MNLGNANTYERTVSFHEHAGNTDIYVMRQVVPCIVLVLLC